MKTEKVFAVIILLALSMKYMHWAGGNVILILSMTILSMLYFPLAFYFLSHKGLKNQNIPLSVISGLFFSIAILGMMFKLMYWPGSGPMITTGLFGSLIALAAVFIVSRNQKAAGISNLNKVSESKSLDSFIDNKKEEDANLLNVYYSKLLIRTVIIATITLLLYIIPTSALITFQYRDDPEMARLMIRTREYPLNKQYKDELHEYQYKKGVIPNFKKEQP